MVFFRVDANQHIATGHLMRCISIAQCFLKHGETVEFLIADNHPIILLEKHGIEYIVLHSRWDDVDNEIDDVTKIIQQFNDPLLIIDTYSVNRKYTEKLIPYCKCCYLGSKSEYLGNLYALINYSVSIDYAFYHATYTDETKLLLGPTYMPLRDEFIQKLPQTKNENQCKVLLTTGGSNPNHYIEKILRSIMLSPIFPKINIALVIGGMFESKETIRHEFESYPNIIVYENVASMAEIMYQCDFAVTANGSTVYELAACHIPTITFAMAKDQVNAAEKMNSLKAAKYCGVIFEDEDKCIKNIVSNMSLFLENPSIRKTFAENASEVVDGHGCEHIYYALIC